MRKIKYMQKLKRQKYSRQKDIKLLKRLKNLFAITYKGALTSDIKICLICQANESVNFLNIWKDVKSLNIKKNYIKPNKLVTVHLCTRCSSTYMDAFNECAELVEKYPAYACM